MNVRFPKAQDSIAALGEIGIASLVPVSIGFLNGVEGILVDGGVSMPEIAIPLNNQTPSWIQNINNEFATNYLLLKEGNAETFQNGASGKLKRICVFAGRKTQCAMNALHINRIIAASVRAIFYRRLESPTRYIERVTAGYAPLDDTTTARVDSILPGDFFGLCGVLPNICAIYRAERNGATAARYKLLAAIATGVSTALVAPCSKVGARQERLTAFLAWFRCACDVFHGLIIPWSVAKCN